MKKFFKCYNCKKRNEFDTEEIKRRIEHLSESRDPNPKDNVIAYLVECKYCNTENEVKV